MHVLSARCCTELHICTISFITATLQQSGPIILTSVSEVRNLRLKKIGLLAVQWTTDYSPKKGTDSGHWLCQGLWLGLTYIVLNKRNQTQENSCCLIPFTLVSRKGQFIESKNRFIYRDRKQRLPGAESGNGA